MYQRHCWMYCVRVRCSWTRIRVAEALGTYKPVPSSESLAQGASVRAGVSDNARSEAHLTPSWIKRINFFEAFPNATRIAFTGTPLITEQHANHRTVKRSAKSSTSTADGRRQRWRHAADISMSAARRHGAQRQAWFRHEVRRPVQGAQRGGNSRRPRTYGNDRRSSLKPISASSPSPVTWSITTSTISCRTASRRRSSVTPS